MTAVSNPVTPTGSDMNGMSSVDVSNPGVATSSASTSIRGGGPHNQNKHHRTNSSGTSDGNVSLGSWAGMSVGGSFAGMSVGTLLQRDAAGNWQCPKHPTAVIENQQCSQCEQEYRQLTQQLQSRRAQVARQLQDFPQQIDLLHLQQQQQQQTAAGAQQQNALFPSQQQFAVQTSWGNTAPPALQQHAPQASPPSTASYQPQQQQHQSQQHQQNFPPPFHPQQPQQAQQQASPSFADTAMHQQMQRLQQMQDWMLLQKDQELTLEKKRNSDLQEQCQQLRVENALLTEKLHQQEQRMQQELKLIKLTVQQKQQQRKLQQQTHQQQLVVVPHPTSNNNNLKQQHQQARWGNNNNNNRRGSQQSHYHNHHDDEVEDDHHHHNSDYNNHQHHDEDEDRSLDVTEMSPEHHHHHPHATDDFHDSAGTLIHGHHKTTIGGGDHDPRNETISPLSGSPYKHHHSATPNTAGSSHRSQASGSIAQPPVTWKPETVDGPPKLQFGEDDLVDTPSVNTLSVEEEQEHEVPKQFTVDDRVVNVPLEETISVGTPAPHQQQQKQNVFTYSEEDSTAAHKEEEETKQQQEKETIQQKQQQQQEQLDTGDDDSTWSYVLEEKKTASEPSMVHQRPFMARNQSTSTMITSNSSSTAPVNNHISSNFVNSHKNKFPPLFPAPPRSSNISGNKGVSWTDDAASAAGQSVASSTFGEDRHKVTEAIILDPYGDRGTYSGIILRSTGMPHGAGHMVYAEDHRSYNGEWRHGRWHGFGKATFANGDQYTGEYRFDQRHGRGKYEWHDGRVYDGCVTFDALIVRLVFCVAFVAVTVVRSVVSCGLLGGFEKGDAVVTHALLFLPFLDTERSERTSDTDRASSCGPMVPPTKGTLLLLLELFELNGIFPSPAGCCPCRLTHSTSCFEHIRYSEFRNGQREGQGVYKFSDGGRYEGSWRDGRYSGFGTCSWEDGRCYKGYVIVVVLLFLLLCQCVNNRFDVHT